MTREMLRIGIFRRKSVTICILASNYYERKETMSCTEYRIYPDGTVLSEDEYEEDVLQSYSDDYKTVEVPDEVRDHIIDGFVASGAAPLC